MTQNIVSMYPCPECGSTDKVIVQFEQEEQAQDCPHCGHRRIVRTYDIGRCWWCHSRADSEVITGKPTCSKCRYLAAREAIEAGLITRQPHLRGVTDGN